MSKAINLSGKNAIITGASKGIGRAVAERLAANGVNLFLAARTQTTLDEAVKEISKKYKIKAYGLSTDVSRLEDLQRLVVTAIKEFRTIDILVNNAGVTSQYPFEKQPMEDLEKLAHTNYLGYVRLIRLVIPYMLEQKSGAIINMVSGSTLCDPLPRNFLAYSSLKVGLRSFLKGLFWEMRDRGIKVTSILPGVVDSDLTGHLQDIAKEQRDRLMSAETVADMVMFALTCPQNACPLELAVINQQTPWTKPVIDYAQVQAR